MSTFVPISFDRQMICEIYGKARNFGPAFALLDGSTGGAPTPQAIYFRNLPTKDLRVAQVLMEASASLSARTQFPVYRFRVSFHPADRVDPTLFEPIAAAILADMDAGELHAVVALGRISDRESLYFVVNRVHPEHGKAWDTDRDVAELMSSLRRLEVQHGLHAVPTPARSDPSAPRLGWNRLLETGFERAPYGDTLPAGTSRARIDRSAWGKGTAGIHLFAQNVGDGSRFWFFAPWTRSELYEFFRTLPDGSYIELCVREGKSPRKRWLVSAQQAE